MRPLSGKEPYSSPLPLIHRMPLEWMKIFYHPHTEVGEDTGDDIVHDHAPPPRPFCRSPDRARLRDVQNTKEEKSSEQAWKRTRQEGDGHPVTHPFINHNAWIIGGSHERFSAIADGNADQQCAQK